MGWVMMDERELHRIGVLSEIQTGNRTIASGAAVLGLTARHMRRLLDWYEQLGASDLAHGLRNRPSNGRRTTADRDRALLALLRQHYTGYGPAQASEKLLERHVLNVPRETLRSWTGEAGLWLN
jgi:hypothetical protein